MRYHRCPWQSADPVRRNDATGRTGGSISTTTRYWRCGCAICACDFPAASWKPKCNRCIANSNGAAYRFEPHVWLSEEWFSPDGMPGIAIPFFVAHPRLRQLERSIMGEVEGGNALWRLRLLRHEAGHALDTAYGLRRRADWRAVFGPASSPYPEPISPNRAVAQHVLHVGHWYAQSHPTEDFAETFAVWLQPKARWRRDYSGWPALAKLEFVDHADR